MTFCAGLSAAGMKPVFPVYSSFLQRSYDNLLHDFSLQGLGGIMAVDRAGLSPDDGATHHGIYDVSFLLQNENCTVLSPVSVKSIEPMLTYALYSKGGLCALRYPKGGENPETVNAFYLSDEDYRKIGIKLAFAKEGSLAHCKYIFISYGRAVYEAIEAARILNAEEKDSAGVILLELINKDKALTDKIAALIPKDARVVFSEEGVRQGGAGMLFQSALLEDHGIKIKLCAIEDVPDRDSLQRQFEYCKLDSASLIEAVKEN